MAPRTPLLHPRAYFEERGFEAGPALVAVGATLLGIAAVVIGFGVLFSVRLTAAGYEDIAASLWGVLFGQLVSLLVLSVIGWGLTTAVLHILARGVLSHDASFEETLVVTGWGFVPSIVPTAIGFVLIAVALGDVSVSSPGTFLWQFRTNLANTGAVQPLAGFLVTAWQAFIYAHGLAVEFDTNTGIAAVVGVVVAYGFWLLALI